MTERYQTRVHAAKAAVAASNPLGCHLGTMRSTLVAAAVVLFAPLLAGAQETDFSGTWTQTSPALSEDASNVERIEQRGRHITVTVEKSGPAGPFGYRSWGDHTYTIGGPVESRKNDAGLVRTVAVIRDGTRLVFITTTTEGANTTIQHEAWSLLNDGTYLVKDRHTTDWRGTSEDRIILARK